MKLDGQTQFAGVMGWPVAHSLSPLIHGYWLEKHQINAVYLPFPTQPDHLNEVITALPHMGCVGVNLTIPHKQAVMPLLDAVDDTARGIGAVNTVAMKDGERHGFNTDAYGFIEGLKAQADFHTGQALVIGAGGAARAVVHALDQAGFTTIYIMNRTREKAEILTELSSHAKVINWQQAPAELKDTDLLVNTTALGMTGKPTLDLDITDLPPHAAVCDIVYAPLETALLKQARMQKLSTADGLGMLLYQAQKAFAIWFGVTPDVDDELRQRLIQHLEAV